MSPQLSLSAVAQSTNNGDDMKTVIMSNTELAQATATAFSSTQRLDADLPPTSAVGINPLDNGHQLSRKRRACGDNEVSRSAFPNCSVNFLSGIFDDIAKAQAQTPSDMNADVMKTSSHQLFSGTSHLDNGIITHKNKKSRSRLSRSLSRCRKSFKNIPAAFTSSSAATVSTEVTQITDLSSHTVSGIGVDGEYEPQSPIPTDQVIVSDHFTDAASIIDEVLNGNIPFPKLPASVSEYSCSTNNNSIQIMENSALDLPKKRLLKACYGWFVETDEDEQLRKRAQAIADASIKAWTSIDNSLSFSAATASKNAVDDDELEWAKAADTIDDVLGDFF